jgi:hypothetical protein
MATTTISDYVIWTKHIHGDATLTDRLVRLSAGETIGLRVDGVAGTWRKMDDGKDGRPTPGLRPLGRTRTFWSALFKSRRGDSVSLEYLPPVTSGVGETESAPFQSAPVPLGLGAGTGGLLRTPVERAAALSALLDGAKGGWRAEGRSMSRDEMHDR